MKGFKRCHVPNNYETNLPNKQQLKQAFQALDNDQERAIFMMYASSGLRHKELLDLTKDDIDFEMRCIKSKHDTRTKRAGVTFYNQECEKYLKKYLATREDNSEVLFDICFNQFRLIWIKATKSANIKITPQVLRKWHATTLGELMVPDRFVDVFQGRAPKGVLAKHYTGKGLETLKMIFEKVNLTIIEWKID